MAFQTHCAKHPAPRASWRARDLTPESATFLPALVVSGLPQTCPSGRILSRGLQPLTAPPLRSTSRLRGHFRSGLPGHQHFSFPSRLVSARSRPQAGPRSSSRCPAAFPEGRPLQGKPGKQKRDTPEGGREVSRRDQRGPARTSRGEGARTGRSLKDTKRQERGWRTPRVRRDCREGFGFGATSRCLYRDRAGREVGLWRRA